MGRSIEIQSSGVLDRAKFKSVFNTCERQRVAGGITCHISSVESDLRRIKGDSGFLGQLNITGKGDRIRSVQRDCGIGGFHTVGHSDLLGRNTDR